jgi:Putative peptidoglycan binding domain/N-acetylmuramoyl-L-alanine amidase
LRELFFTFRAIGGNAPQEPEASLAMTFLVNPQHYAHDELRTMIHSVEIGAWIPKFATLHNTGVPSLKQYLGYGPTAQAQFAANQASYERGLGWHPGVHFFCCPAYVWNVCDLRADGVSVSCWNHETIGIEMVGDYEVGGDDFASGFGKSVRDNAVWTLACLHEKFGWEPETIRFHRECRADHHSCPGSKVDKAAIIEAVKSRIATLSSNPLIAARTQAMPEMTRVSPEYIAIPQIWSVEDIQGALNRLGDCLTVDGEYGPATKAAISSFQSRLGLDVDGWACPDTAAALKAALVSR